VSTRFLSGSVLAALLLLSGPAAIAQGAECSGKTAAVSKKIFKTMNAATEAVNSKQWDEAIAKVQEAQANPAPKTLFDEYLIHQILGKAYTAKKQYREAVQEFDLIKDTPCLSEPERGEFLKLMTRLYYQLDDFPKVIEIGNKALAISRDPDLPLLLGQAYYLQKDYANSRRFMEGVVAKLEEQGKPPGEQNIRLIQGACVSMNDDACTTASSRSWCSSTRSPSIGRISSIRCSTTRRPPTSNSST
jgi:tetratricopeptide (TPR) repeat protein